MTKKYLATQDEVAAVSTDVAAINSQINTPTAGLDARVQATEAYDARITQAEDDIDGLDAQINDPATGILKQLVDVDTELNEATTGVKARLDDLEQGGTSTTKFRTHSPSGVYEDGEAVQLNDIIYKANGPIDGSSTPIPLVVGAGANTWTALDKKDPVSPVAFQDGDTGAVTVMQGLGGSMLVQSFSITTPPNRIDWTFNPDRCRVSYAHNGNQAAIEANDVLRLRDITGSANSVISVNLPGNSVLVTTTNGKIGASSISTTKLNYLEDVTSDIKTQFDNKQNKMSYPYSLMMLGKISTTGTKSDTYGTFSSRRLSTGLYEIYGHDWINKMYSFIVAESVSDDDNVYVIYDRTEYGFKIKWYDMPSMVAQDLQFVFRLIRYN